MPNDIELLVEISSLDPVDLESKHKGTIVMGKILSDKPHNPANGPFLGGKGAVIPFGKNRNEPSQQNSMPEENLMQPAAEAYEKAVMALLKQARLQHEASITPNKKDKP